jgi:hypothetical protein
MSEEDSKSGGVNPREGSSPSSGTNKPRTLLLTKWIRNDLPAVQHDLDNPRI